MARKNRRSTDRRQRTTLARTAAFAQAFNDAHRSVVTRVVAESAGVTRGDVHRARRTVRF